MYSAQRAKTRARQRSKFAPTLELTAGDVVHELSEEAPFEPPPADDIFGLGECEDEETLFVEQDDVPFDPPELEPEPVFSAPPQVEPKPEPAPKPQPIVEAPPSKDRPLPAINIFAAWDRPEAEALMRTLSSDPRLARTEMQIARGGIDAAVTHGNADLFVLDTTLDGPAMLSALDRLREIAPRACVVILGSVNDIALLRELASRGVSDYIVPPAKADDIARSLCALFADVDTAKTIAVIGARGGIGASTIARNLAWSIAERQQQKTTLVDLDLCFGAAAVNFRQEPSLSVLDVAEAEDSEDVLTKALSKPTPHLQLLAAPKTTANLEIESEAFESLLANVRRTASFVVLDLPHAWEPWVRTALCEADEVILVAGPDLASLRNADNMLKLLRSERDKASAPNVVISMSGLPKRPEIPAKDFAEAIHVKPLLTFAFEPELFVSAEMDGQMIYEAAPDSKAALQLDVLASMLTGHEPISQPAPRVAKEEPGAPQLPVLELVTPIPTPRRKQRPARTGFVALQEPQPRRRSTGVVRTVAAIAALTAIGVWYVGQHNLPEAADAYAVSAFRA